MSDLRRLSPEEELRYLEEIHGEANRAKFFDLLAESLNVLQNRAQMLLSLIALCLTITGFSGPTIAAAGDLSRLTLGYGLAFVLVAAMLLLAGPLNVRWVTQYRAGTVPESLIALIRQRDRRTRLYYLAMVFLIIGLTGYVEGVISYLLGLGC